MGRYVEQWWTPQFRDAAPRRLRRPGTYRAYVPDLLIGRSPAMPLPLVRRIADTTADLRDAVAEVEQADLGSLADFFVRTETTASSAIEGEHASPRKVALADFTGYGRPAAMTIVRNLGVVRAAMDRLASAPEVQLDDVVALQVRLVPHLAGVRTGPVWIGGSTPLDARYVAPPAEEVPALLEDLFAWTRDADVDPITRAATFHAQFETIHPFDDGNGRVGRAVTNALLARDGLGGRAVLPLSVALARRRSEYFDALTTWQTQAEVDGHEAWIAYFSDALSAAATLARDLARQADAERTRVRQVLSASRATGLREGSALVAAVDGLFEHPVSTVGSLAARHGVSRPSARDALERLADAGVVRRERIDRGRETAYVADAVLALVAGDWTAPDSGYAPSDPAGPSPVPDLPDGPNAAPPRPGACGALMPLAHRPCRRPAGHSGRHRHTDLKAGNDGLTAADRRRLAAEHQEGAAARPTATQMEDLRAMMATLSKDREPPSPS